MDLSSLTGMFVGLHATFAMMTKTPELAVTEDEGRNFMKAAQNVMRHYSVQTTQKTVDWISFMGIAAGIYGTRAFAISNRLSEERKGGAAERGVVLKFPHGGRTAPPAPAADPLSPLDGGIILTEDDGAGEPPGGF